MIQLTISRDDKEEIRTSKLEKTDAIKKVRDFIANKFDTENSVLVCFEFIADLPIDKLKDEYPSILVSHDKKAIDQFCVKNIRKESTRRFCLFEFESYSEAFEYCIDLREGF